MALLGVVLLLSAPNLNRHVPGHCPDYAAPRGRLIACECGQRFRTLEDAVAHAYFPDPDPLIPVEAADFRYDRTEAGRNAELGREWRRWKRRPMAPTVEAVLRLRLAG